MLASYALERGRRHEALDIDSELRSINPIEFTQYRHPPSSSGASWNR